MLLTDPPLIATSQTPEDIIGPHNIEALRQHIDKYEERAAKPWYKPNKAMAEMINRLHAHGYRIDGFDKYGQIEFRTVLKSKVQQVFEGPELDRIKQMSQGERRALAFRGDVGKVALDSANGRMLELDHAGEYAKLPN